MNSMQKEQSNSSYRASAYVPIAFPRDQLAMQARQIRRAATAEKAGPAAANRRAATVEREQDDLRTIGCLATLRQPFKPQAFEASTQQRMAVPSDWLLNRFALTCPRSRPTHPLIQEENFPGHLKHCCSTEPESNTNPIIQASMLQGCSSSPCCQSRSPLATRSAATKW